MKFCVIAILAACHAQAEPTRTVELAGRSVALTLVDAKDLSPIAWSQHSPELRTISAIVPPDSNVSLLLLANGIAPDSEAFALVYDLNPTIRDFDAPLGSTALQLPSISFAADPRPPGAGSLVELTVDPAIRAQLNEKIEALVRLAPSIDQIVADPAARTQLEKLISWYLQIETSFKRRTDPPLRQASLIQLCSEAGLLATLLQNAHDQHREPSGNELRQMTALYEDIKLEMSAYGQVLGSTTPKPQSFYSVTVNIKGTGSSVVENLRVYYTYNGLFRPLPAQPPIESFGFPQLGSGKSANLLLKNYQIWVAKDGDSNHPVTHPYLLRIDSSSPTSQYVDLVLSSK